MVWRYSHFVLLLICITILLNCQTEIIDNQTSKSVLTEEETINLAEAFDNEINETDLKRNSEFEINENSLGRSYRHCSKDRYKSWAYPEFYTWNQDTSKWIRKGLSPVEKDEIYGYILMIVVIFFGNFWGLGGGGPWMIILYSIFRFEFNKCIHYVAYINLTTAISRFIFFFKERHPKKLHRTLINYDLVISILPMAILGYFTGSIVFGIVSMFVAAVFVAVIYGGVSFNLFLKGIKDFMMERKVENSIQLKIEQEKRLYQNNEIEESKFSNTSLLVSFSKYE